MRYQISAASRAIATQGAELGRRSDSAVCSAWMNLSRGRRLTGNIKISGYIFGKGLEIRRCFSPESLELGSSIRSEGGKLGGRVRVFTLIYQETFGIDFVEFGHFNNK
jgi:hypothetical protein